MDITPAWTISVPRFNSHPAGNFVPTTSQRSHWITRSKPSIIRFRACDAPPSTTVETSESVSAPDYAPSYHSSELSSSAPVRSPVRVPVRRPQRGSPNAPPKKEVPGPEPLPVVGNALDIVGCSLSDLMLRYAQSYGSFVRFSVLKDVLYLASDPEAIFHITNGNARNYLNRWTPPGFEVLLYDGKLKGLVFSQGQYWKQHRQVVGSVFRSSEFLNHYVSKTVEKTSFMINELWKAKHGAVVNVHQEMRMLTLDIIGSAAFGSEFGAMTSPEGAHEIETCLSNILHGVMDVIKSPVPFWRFLRTPGRAAIEDDLKRLQIIELGLIRARRQQLEDDGEFGKDVSKKDLLGMLLRARDSDRSVHFKDEDLMWDVHDVIFAGHETTASALAATLFLVTGSPRVLRKIRNELDDVLPNGSIPNFEDIGRLKYLDMVLNEALRLYPPTALVGRHAKADDIILGYHVPAGANVLMSPYVMGRLESLWDDPLEFRPERFAPEQAALRHPMTHLPFGAGPRICLGARMAMMEAKVILAMIFQQFSFERTQNELEVVYDSTVSFASGMDMVLHHCK